MSFTKIYLPPSSSVKFTLGKEKISSGDLCLLEDLIGFLKVSNVFLLFLHLLLSHLSRSLLAVVYYLAVLSFCYTFNCNMLAMSEILKHNSNVCFCNGDFKKKSVEIFNIAKVFVRVRGADDKLQ